MDGHHPIDMKHKFYYYEYTDDGGVTWTMGDYRRYLMPIVELANAQPYRFRICNQDDVEIDSVEIQEATSHEMRNWDCTKYQRWTRNHTTHRRHS
jgi:hypothetical protein